MWYNAVNWGAHAMPNFGYLHLMIAKLLACFLALPLVSVKTQRSPDRVIQTWNLATKSQEKNILEFRHLNEASKAKWHKRRFPFSRAVSQRSCSSCSS